MGCHPSRGFISYLSLHSVHQHQSKIQRPCTLKNFERSQFSYHHHKYFHPLLPIELPFRCLAAFAHSPTFVQIHPTLKKLIALIALIAFHPITSSAQPPSYYYTALGLNGQPLRQELHNIIKTHTSVGYAGLWAAYYHTDAKPNGKVWDIYSDIPGQIPPYEYTFGAQQCGTYNSEGDCYNREHTIPETYFNASEPIRSDLFVVYPTDGWVNNKRNNFAYGIVSTPTWTSQNGSKVGINSYSGAPANTAFEPIDSFKGDLARTYFYYATRYYTQDNGWADWDMATGAELKPWALQMLLDWHHADSVSMKEITRNDSAYAIQHNRNPFIDYPIFADCIWGNADCAFLDVANVFHEIPVAIFPNPSSKEINLQFPLGVKENLSISCLNLQGQKVFEQITHSEKTMKIEVADWAKGVYFLQIKNQQRTTYRKILVQ